MILIYIFIISLLGIMAMLSFKAVEIKRRKKTRILSMLSRFDEPLRMQSQKIAGQLDLWDEQGLIFLKEKFPKQTKFFFLLLKKNIKEKYDDLLPNIRGSRVLKKDGHVSPFLRDIAKHKKQNGGGRIDDGMVE